MKYSTQVKKTLSKAINHVSNNVGKFTNKPDVFIRKRKWTPEKIIRIMISTVAFFLLYPRQRKKSLFLFQDLFNNEISLHLTCFLLSFARY